MIDHNCLLFIHIPKTAGTSFKQALKERYGCDYILSDYAHSSAETSPEVLSYIYQQKDPYLLTRTLQNKRVLLGHFPVGKYMHMFPTLNVVTFLREPVSQVLSHYKHWITYNNYTKTIEDFVTDERFKNLQTKYLQAKPLELFGFIGITEHFDASIELFNYTYDTTLKSVHINKSQQIFSFDQSIVNLIQQENQKDIALYQKALQLFNERWNSYKKNKEYIYKLIQEENQEKIRGIAFTKSHNTPAILNINGCSVIAKDFRPGFLIHNLPRNSYVGFEYHY